MGVQNWFKVFGGSARRVTEKEFTGKRIGIDMSYDIYRASLGMPDVKGLTDKDGVPTVLLYVLLCNVVKYRNIKVRGSIYIFDNPKPNPLKGAERKKREAAKKKATEQLGAVGAGDAGEKKRGLEKRAFTLTTGMVDDVKKMLNYLGVAWVVAPEGYEAEHLGAELTRNGTIDTFITSDSDTLLFGGASMTRRVKAGKKVGYEEYKLSTVLLDHKITREELVHMGVVLGCDFAEKTRGVGPATVLEKGAGVVLTDGQKKACAHFLGECPYDEGMVHREAPDMEKLVRWLVDEKGFNEGRVTKMVGAMK